MIKDYTRVDVAPEGVDDLAFVEAVWSAKLGDKVGAGELDLSNRDEYRVMAPFLAGIPAGVSILDGGCGAGDWTVFLQQRGYAVIGLDISERLISRLRERWPKCTWIRGDLRATGLPADSVDVYFSWGAIEHFEEGLSPCLDEAARILRPGGLLCVSVPYANRRHLRAHGAREGELVDPGPKPGTRFYQWRVGRSELAEALRCAKLTVLDVVPIHLEEGVRRLLFHHSWKWLAGPNPAGAAVRRLLCRIIPLDYAAHMVMGVARKPGGNGQPRASGGES